MDKFAVPVRLGVGYSSMVAVMVVRCAGNTDERKQRDIFPFRLTSVRVQQGQELVAVR
jgi:hypothetical protein